MLGWEAWFTICVILLMFVVLLFDLAPSDFAMLVALATLMAAQIVTTNQGLAGFSNSAVLTVAVLYVVAAGINQTGALDYFLSKILGQPKSLAVAQLRLILPVAFVSAFLNNTPVVAIMIPIVQRWSSRIRQPVSQLFIPLSFASILGGTCTLIGTSTNLVVSGLYEDTYNKTMPLFDLGRAGVPVLSSGATYIILFAPLLLPGFVELRRREVEKNGFQDDGNSREIGTDFTVCCVVLPHSKVVDCEVDEAGLRGCDGLYLTSVERDTRVFTAVGPEFVLRANDVLYFTGVVDNFAKFCTERDFQIIMHDEEDYGIGDLYGDYSDRGEVVVPMRHSPNATSRAHLEHNQFDHHMVKVMIREGGAAVGKTPRELDFRRRYDAAIISLSRLGSNSAIHGNIGRVPLAVGDVLLLVTGPRFSFTNPATETDLKPLVSNSVPLEENAFNSVGSYRIDVDEHEDLPEREFLIPMRVSETSKFFGAKSLVGLTVNAAKLRGLPGLFLVAIEHASGEVDHAVGPEAMLEKNDILWFIGERDSMSTLRRIPGLESADNQVEKLAVKRVQRRLVEVVLALRSNMVRKTVREIKFRTRYDAAIIAVHRQGHRVISRIGDIELNAGDVLILETGPNFVVRHRDDPNFLLVAEIKDSEPPRFEKFYVALASIIGMMVVYLIFSDKISLVVPAIFAAAIMVLFGCLTTAQTRAAVSWDVIVTIACAFGISTALQNTGTANAIGEGLVSLASITGTGFVGILTCVYLATFLISIVVANNAAAVLMFPIAVRALEGVSTNDPDLAVTQMMYILMLAASSSFSTPFGYQTNMMVLNCGNYVFLDFIKFGFPMQFWQMVFSVVFVYYLDYWYLMWIAAIGMFVCVVVVRTAPQCLHRVLHLNKLEMKPLRRMPKHSEMEEEEESKATI